MKLNPLGWIAFVLVIIGGINWGLVALDYNLVSLLLGEGTVASKVVYGLVGLSAVFMIFAGTKRPPQPVM